MTDMLLNDFNTQLGLQILLTALSIAIYLITNSIVRKTILNFGHKRRYIEKRTVYIKKFFGTVFFAVLLVTLAIIWGIDIRGIFIFASSFFAVVGVALFASWSVLSNITSSVILYFSFPYKIGDRIRILDGDNSVEGVINDITAFCLEIETSEGDLVSYPNSLALQKPVLKCRKK